MLRKEFKGKDETIIEIKVKWETIQKEKKRKASKAKATLREKKKPEVPYFLISTYIT